MPRDARIVIEGMPHHVTQRGNYRQEIFEDDFDREHYLDLINEYSQKYGLKHYAYCLMKNHVHFISVPENLESLGSVFKLVHMRYSQYFNKKRKCRGHLWQGRFYSCPMDDEHLMSCVRYIERNPVRANIVKKAWLWEWSSARDHIGEYTSKVVLEDTNDLIGISFDDWRGYLEGEDDDVEAIRSSTLKGIPFAGIDFIGEIERKLGRKIVKNSRGRPKLGTDTI